MIYVLGSINHDISLEVERLPKKGETVSADSCRTGLGGKGANQAVAIARLGGGAPIKMIGRVGADAIGSQLIDRLKEYGVDTEFVRQVNRATGTAMITAKRITALYITAARTRGFPRPTSTRRSSTRRAPTRSCVSSKCRCTSWRTHCAARGRSA